MHKEATNINLRKEKEKEGTASLHESGALGAGRFWVDVSLRGENT